MVSFMDENSRGISEQLILFTCWVTSVPAIQLMVDLMSLVLQQKIQGFLDSESEKGEVWLHAHRNAGATDADAMKRVTQTRNS